MAITIVSNAHTETGNAGVTSFALAAPAGLNDTMLDVIIAAGNDSGSGANPITVSNDGTAYTSIQTGNVDLTFMFGEYAAFRKTGAASPGSVTIGMPGPYARRGLALRLAISGVDLASPIEAQSSSLTETSSPDGNPVTLTVPAITTVNADAMVIGVVVAMEPGTYSAVSGWTLEYQAVSYAASFAPSFAVYRRTIASPGTSGDLASVFTKDPIMSDTGYNLIGGMFALKAAASAPPAVMRSRANFFGL